MIQINLIPDVKLQLIKTQETKSKVIKISIILMIVSLASVFSLGSYSFIVQSLVNTKTDQDIAAEEKKLNDVTDLTKILTIQNQLKSISEVNNKKKINSRVFDMITTLKISGNKNVSYSGIIMDQTQGTLQINGQTESYQSYDTFKKTLINAQIEYKQSSDASVTTKVPLASVVSLPETSYGIDSNGNRVLTFTIVFNYNTILLEPSISDVHITIVRTGNASDSYLGVPTSLFSDKATSISGGQ
jgi:hypothetical protein